MTQTREKWDSLFWVEAVTLNDMNMPWYSIFPFLFFMFWKKRYKRAIGLKPPSLLCFFFESIIPKVLDHNDNQNSLSTITKHLDNSIWKTPYNWRFYGHRCQTCTKILNLLLYASLSLKQTRAFKFNLMLIEQILPQFF